RKRSFRAKVLAVEGEAVDLDQTYFYPEGGGQEADHGTIADREVYDVQRMGTSILHFVRGDATSVLKKRVACVIDGERREALMRNHTATHIVLGAARKALGNHVWQAGAHKAPDLARLDITHYDALTDAEVARIEELANGEVLGHHQVRAKVLARDVAEKKFGFRLYQGGSVPGGELRVVEIPKWDVEACGGTHVSRTSDVSLIKILRSTRIQDGVVRLEYAAGKGALDAMRRQSDDLRRAADILSVPPDQVVSGAERRETRRDAREGRADRRRGSRSDGGTGIPREGRREGGLRRGELPERRPGEGGGHETRGTHPDEARDPERMTWTSAPGAVDSG